MILALIATGSIAAIAWWFVFRRRSLLDEVGPAPEVVEPKPEAPPVVECLPVHTDRVVRRRVKAVKKREKVRKRKGK